MNVLLEDFTYYLYIFIYIDDRRYYNRYNTTAFKTNVFDLERSDECYIGFTLM